MKPPYDPPAMMIFSVPAQARSPSTSAAHCAWVNGSRPSLSPLPRASKTITRYSSANGPNEVLGSAIEPRPGAPWCTMIVRGPVPSTSTLSRFPLISTYMSAAPRVACVVVGDREQGGGDDQQQDRQRREQGAPPGGGQRPGP